MGLVSRLAVLEMVRASMLDTGKNRLERRLDAEERDEMELLEKWRGCSD